MANDSFDPTQLAEYAAIMQQVQAILADIEVKDQNLLVTSAEKARRTAEQLTNFQQLLELKFREAEASGAALDNEQKRNLLLEQHRTNLQTLLAQLTTQHAKTAQELTATNNQIKDIESAISNLNTETAQGAAQFASLQNQLSQAQLRQQQLSAQMVQMTEQERQSQVRKITTEMQYTDAKLKSSQAAQSAMTMLLGLDNEWRKTLAASMMRTLSAATQARASIAGVGDAISHMATSLSNAGSFGNVMGSSLMKIQETTIHMVTQLDRADVGLRSATGASKEFARGMVRAFEDREIKNMAATYGELQQMIGAAYSAASSYSQLNNQQRMEFDRTAMAAKRFGISFDQSAAIMDKSLRVFGIRGPAMMDQLYRSAVAIGESPANAIRNASQALDVMAQYSGPRAMEVLRGLQSIAKSTGIAMNQLTQIANQFDTFETAATNVAKLNAILGGAYFNSVQMLNASEEKRLYLLRSGLDATNRSWESLGRFEKKALAAAAGMKSMAVAGAFFRGNMAEFDRLTKMQEESAMTQMKLVQAGSQVVDVFQQIKRIMMDFGIGLQQILRYTRAVVGIMKDLGFEGIVLTKILFGVASSTSQWVMQVNAARAALPGTAMGVRALGSGLLSVLPLLGLATFAWMKFSEKLSEEKSPPAFQLPGIAAQGLSALGENAKRAAPSISTLANRINAINDKQVVSLTRALGAASQISAPNLNFNQATFGISEVTRAVNNLNVKKVDSFSNAMARLGAVMQTIPRENVVAVTQLTKEARAVSALPIAAAARQGAQISAQGSAVRAARSSETQTGGRGGGGMEGVLVTDSISVNVGGTVLTQRIQDTVRDTFAKYERRTG